MFWRLVRRSFWQSQRRTRVALVALWLAAVVSAALLNLYFDARQKVGSELRRYGANMMVTPASVPAAGATELLDESLAADLERAAEGRLLQVLPFLYAVAEVSGQSVVLAGTWLDRAADLRAHAQLSGGWLEDPEDKERCLIGVAVASRFGFEPGHHLTVRYADREKPLQVAGVIRTGSQEDNAILVNLSVAQTLTAAPGKVSVLLGRGEGRPEALDALARALHAKFPGIVVKPLREMAESEARVLDRIQGMLWGTTAVVLLLTALSVLTTMTALATERRREVGLWKALGGSQRGITRLFLAEAALGAVLAGIAGAAPGVALSRWLGQQIFSSQVAIRWMTLPAAIGITLGVALLGTYVALRWVQRLEPAMILREN